MVVVLGNDDDNSGAVSFLAMSVDYGKSAGCVCCECVKYRKSGDDGGRK